MTGFGRGAAERDGRRISLEIRSVNHRNLDLNIRLYRSVSFLEEFIRARIGTRVTRGHIDVYIHYQNERDDQKKVAVDLPLARAYSDSLRKLSAALGLRGRPTAETMAGLPDVLRVTEREEDEAELTSLTQQALDGALDELSAMRLREGERLRTDVLDRLAELERLAEFTEERAPGVVSGYRDRLKTRIEELCQASPVDDARLAMEIAIFADRASIDEEMVRLKSHIAETRRLMDSGEPVGRKLDFLVQEINREINTLCSKANDLDITNAGLAMKCEAEKIREQMQNVE